MAPHHMPWLLSPSFLAPSQQGGVLTAGILSAAWLLTTAAVECWWVLRSPAGGGLGALPGWGCSSGDVEALQHPSKDGVGEQVCEESGEMDQLCFFPRPR